MRDLIDLPEKIFVSLGLVRIAIVGLGLMVVAFIVTVLLSCFKRGYGLKKRLWYLFFNVGVITTVYTATVLLGQGKGWFLIVLSLSAFFTAPILVLPERKVKFEQSHRSFIRYIDNQLNDKNYENRQIQTEKPELFTPNEEERENMQSLKDFELDFKHVKSVIERLEYYGLSQADKKIVKDLENAINEAEAGDYRLEIKSRINDGLGALLKIMSKYGV